MPPVNLGLGGGTSTFTSLRNISRGGLCISRRGQLELSEGSEVYLEIHQPGSELRLRCRAQVRWCHYAGFNTYIGLSFCGTHLPRLNFLEELLAGMG